MILGCNWRSSLGLPCQTPISVLRMAALPQCWLCAGLWAFCCSFPFAISNGLAYPVEVPRFSASGILIPFPSPYSSSWSVSTLGCCGLVYSNETAILLCLESLWWGFYGEKETKDGNVNRGSVYNADGESFVSPCITPMHLPFFCFME